jgi:hypothetical protein
VPLFLKSFLFWVSYITFWNFLKIPSVFKWLIEIFLHESFRSFHLFIAIIIISVTLHQTHVETSVMPVEQCFCLPWIRTNSKKPDAFFWGHFFLLHLVQYPIPSNCTVAKLWNGSGVLPREIQDNPTECTNSMEIRIVSLHNSATLPVKLNGLTCWSGDLIISRDAVGMSRSKQFRQ